MKGTIAFITSLFSNDFSRIMMLAIEEKLIKEGFRLISFTGSSIEDQILKWSQETSNAIYDLVSPERFDGVIVYGGAIGQFASNRVMENFCTGFRLPVVNISSVIPGITSIQVSNYSGMYSIVEHLVKEHDCRKLGFVKGPSGHSEAEERFKAFKDVLNRYGLEIDSKYIYPGNFSPDDGVNAAREYIEKSRGELDALVCVDDDTAFGVLDEFLKSGVNVPREIAVIGFDDAEASGSVYPPLSTVKQPFKTLGEKAVTLLLHLLEGGEVDEVINIPAEPVIRDSCGCMKTVHTIFPVSKDTLDRDFIINSTENELLESIKGRFPDLLNIESDFIKGFLDSFCLAINKGDETSFFDSFYILAEKVDHKKMNQFNEFLDYCSNILMLRCGRESQAKLLLERIKVRSSINIIRDRVLDKVNTQKKYFNLNDINQNLHGALTIDSLLNKAYTTLPEIGIKSFYLFFSRDDRFISDEVDFIYGFNKDGVLTEYSPSMGKLKILPDNYFDTLTLPTLVISLSFTTEVFGYIVLEVEESAVELTHAIAWHFSSSLKRIAILEEKNRKARELEETLYTLKETQEQLIESEKLSSLGSMVAGVAHEINTPIGIVVTSISFIQDLIKELNQSFKESSLSKKQLEYFLESMDELMVTTMNSANRAAKLVSSFKKVAVDQASEDKREFKLKEYIEEIIISLHNRMKKTGHSINIEAEKEIEVDSFPGALSQVVTNLILNSLTHGFESMNDGVITISITEIDESVRIEYWDNGVGIPEEYIHKVFEPFFTTKRNSGGSGLGLHIVHNLVTQVLKGNITIRSKIGEGTMISIEFPKFIK